MPLLLNKTQCIAGTAAAAVSVAEATLTTTTSRPAGARAPVMATARRSADTVEPLASAFFSAVASMRWWTPEVLQPAGLHPS